MKPCICGHIPKMAFKRIGHYMIYVVYCKHCYRKGAWASTKNGAIDLFYGKEKAVGTGMQTASCKEIGLTHSISRK